MLGLALLASGCPMGRHSGPAPALQLRVLTVPATESQAYRRDQYLHLVAYRANVTGNPDSEFWRALRWYFVDRNSSVILTADVKMNGRAFGLFPLYSLKTSTASYNAAAINNLPLAAPLRLQEADDFSIHLSLIEVTQDHEEQLLRLLKGVSTTASALPVSTVVPGGEAAFDVMTSLMQAVQILGKPKNVALEVEDHVNPLWKASYLVIVPTQDIEGFRADQARLLSPDWDARPDDPTFVALRVDRKDQLFTPDLALGPSSPIRDKVSGFVRELKTVGDDEKVSVCRRLRSFLQTDLGLNAKDETAVVLGAMREGGYDPDRSRAHLRGCLSSDDIDAARRAGFRWGSCSDSTPCRLALGFADAWVGRKPLSGIAASPTSLYDHLFGSGTRRDDDPVGLTEDLTLFPNYALPSPEAAGTASLVGYLARAGGEARKARIVFCVSGEGEGARIDRIDLCDATTPPEACTGVVAPAPSK